MTKQEIFEDVLKKYRRVQTYYIRETSDDTYRSECLLEKEIKEIKQRYEEAE